MLTNFYSFLRFYSWIKVTPHPQCAFLYRIREVCVPSNTRLRSKTHGVCAYLVPFWGLENACPKPYTKYLHNPRTLLLESNASKRRHRWILWGKQNSLLKLIIKLNMTNVFTSKQIKVEVDLRLGGVTHNLVHTLPYQENTKQALQTLRMLIRLAFLELLNTHAVTTLHPVIFCMHSRKASLPINEVNFSCYIRKCLRIRVNFCRDLSREAVSNAMYPCHTSAGIGVGYLQLQLFTTFICRQQ